MNHVYFENDGLVDQEENHLMKIGRKMLEAIVCLLLVAILMLIWKLIRLKFVEFVQGRNLKRFSRHSVINDPGRIPEIVSLDDGGLSS
jgi:hypothetical protein